MAKVMVNNTYRCQSCSINCIACANSSFCTQCASPYLININSTSQSCVANCSSSQVQYNQSCLYSCPLGLNNLKGFCQAMSVASSSHSSASSSVIPLPLTIILLALIGVCIFSKINYSKTIFPAALCSFNGLVQSASWIIFTIILGVDQSAMNSSGVLTLIIISLAMAISLGLNIISFILFMKHIWRD